VLIMIRILCFSALATALIAAAPAQSQSRRELAERIDATEVRIGELESSFMAGDPVAETLLRRLDALDYQVRELTGETERLQFENRRLTDEVGMLQAELDAMRNPQPPAIDDATADWMNDGLGGEPTSADGESVAVTDPDDQFASERAAATGVLGAPSPGDAGTSFRNARDRLNDGDFAGAQSGFEAFVNDHAEHPRAGEAWYWLGETFFVRSQFADAASSYISSLRAQPEGEKAPDALVRLAASLHGLGRTQDACDTLARFGREFPNATPASRDRAARESVRANCQ
jgi:tol-pal system protein YbgF